VKGGNYRPGGKQGGITDIGGRFIRNQGRKHKREDNKYVKSRKTGEDVKIAKSGRLYTSGRTKSRKETGVAYRWGRVE